MSKLRSLLLIALLLPAACLARESILILGDSLSAGYGIPLDKGWVMLLQDRLDATGYGYKVINASMSGETSGGALTRIARALETHRPAVVIVELGGNDGLRGISVQEVESNLATIIEKSHASGAKVLLAGILVPPNYGPRYSEGFRRLYLRLQEQYDVTLLPFFLERVAMDPGMMQADGIHPNARAQPRLLENVWPLLQPLLESSDDRD